MCASTIEFRPRFRPSVGRLRPHARHLDANSPDFGPNWHGFDQSWAIAAEWEWATAVEFGRHFADFGHGRFRPKLGTFRQLGPTRATSGPHTHTFCRVQAEFGRHGAEPGRMRPTPGHVCPDLGQLRPTSANSAKPGPTSTDPGPNSNIGPNSTEFGPISADLWPKSATIGQDSAYLGHRPNSDIGQIRPRLPRNPGSPS